MSDVEVISAPTRETRALSTPPRSPREHTSASTPPAVQPIQIGLAQVGPGHPAFVIAEAGVNHDGQMGLAKELIHAAADAEADAVKFQVFAADRLVMRTAPTAVYQAAAGAGTSQYEMLARLELKHEQFAELYAYAGRCGIEFLATPFSIVDLKFLVDLGVRAIKLASPEVVNAPLLDAAARSGLPLILSTGAAELEEIAAAVERLQAADVEDLALLHCISSYPARVPDANLGAIGTLARCFGTVTGFSDHTESVDIGGYAAAAGASIIEKHFTLDRKRSGPDHAFSLEPDDLTAYIRNIRRAEMLLGSGQISVTPSQRNVRDVARASLVASRDLQAGEEITADALAAKRPGGGICPMDIDLLIGRRVRSPIPADTPVSWDAVW